MSVKSGSVRYDSSRANQGVSSDGSPGPRQLAAMPGDRPRARILSRASTNSGWVAGSLDPFVPLGHDLAVPLVHPGDDVVIEAFDREIIVTAANFTPMYATWNRRVRPSLWRGDHTGR
jgi:hypothetical protein